MEINKKDMSCRGMAGVCSNLYQPLVCFSLCERAWVCVGLCFVYRTGWCGGRLRGYAVYWQLASINKCRRQGGDAGVESERTRELGRATKKSGRRGWESGGGRMGGLIERDWYRCTERLKRMCVLCSGHDLPNTHHMLNQSATPPSPDAAIFLYMCHNWGPQSLLLLCVISHQSCSVSFLPCLVWTLLVCETRGLHQIRKREEEETKKKAKKNEKRPEIDKKSIRWKQFHESLWMWLCKITWFTFSRSDAPSINLSCSRSLSLIGSRPVD